MSVFNVGIGNISQLSILKNRGSEFIVSINFEYSGSPETVELLVELVLQDIDPYGIPTPYSFSKTLQLNPSNTLVNAPTTYLYGSVPLDAPLGLYSAAVYLKHNGQVVKWVVSTDVFRVE